MILDTKTSDSQDTSDFLQIAKEEGFVEDRAEGEKKKSTIILDKKIVFSPISSTTLLKRSNFMKKL